MTQGSERVNNHSVKHNVTRANPDEAQSGLKEQDQPLYPQGRIFKVLGPFSATAARGIRLCHRFGKITTDCKLAFIKYGKFAGPGFLIAVAYIDP